jgi:hypothetical protein
MSDTQASPPHPDEEDVCTASRSFKIVTITQEQFTTCPTGSFFQMSSLDETAMMKEVSLI